MPRLEPGRRAKRWKIKTSPELWHPVLESKHEVSSQLISLHYTQIDAIYERVAEILDRYGIISQVRLLYRSFAEEMYKLSKTITKSAIQYQAEAVSRKYLFYGADRDVLREIARLFNLDVLKYFKEGTAEGETTNEWTIALDWDTRNILFKTLLLKNEGGYSLDFQFITRVTYHGNDYIEVADTLEPGDMFKASVNTACARIIIKVKSTEMDKPTTWRVEYAYM